VQNTRADDPRWFPVYEAIVERDRAVIIHAGREPHRSSAVGFSYMAGVLARYPLLRVQIAHLGFDEIDDFAALLDHYPNVYLDTAAIPGTRLHLPESALHALIMRYPDRIIYGSDMPILEEPVTDHWWRIWNAAESEEIRQRIFVINARHFWGEA
jgi:predicted TIM-barrel fold metal-dependent hydrolase